MHYRHYDFPATMPSPDKSAGPTVKAGVGFGTWILIFIVTVLVSAAVTFGVIWFTMRQSAPAMPEGPGWDEHSTPDMPEEDWGEEAPDFNGPSMPEREGDGMDK